MEALVRPVTSLFRRRAAPAKDAPRPRRKLSSCTADDVNWELLPEEMKPYFKIFDFEGPDAMLHAIVANTGSLGQFEAYRRNPMITVLKSADAAHCGYKILKYDLTRLIRIGGLFSMFTVGTIFTMDGSLYKNIGSMVLVCGIMVVALSYSLEVDDLIAYPIKPWADLVSHINGFVPFVLAFYVGLTLTRWWQLRINALGKLFEGLANICLVLSVVLPGPKWAPMRALVVRYGMASITLTINAARRNQDLSLLLDDQLLTEREILLLEDVALYQRAMVMWSWIARITEEAIKIGKAPTARQNAILSKAMQARSGINTIHTYLDTQLPFPYVHLITFIVNVQNLTLAIKCGAAFAVARAQSHYEVMAGQIVIVLLVGTVYQGLLSISYVVSDPFGEDLLDLPINHFVKYVGSSCLAFERAQSICPAFERLHLAEQLAAQEAAAAQEKEARKRGHRDGHHDHHGHGHGVGDYGHGHFHGSLDEKKEESEDEDDDEGDDDGGDD